MHEVPPGPVRHLACAAKAASAFSIRLSRPRVTSSHHRQPSKSGPRAPTPSAKRTPWRVSAVNPQNQVWGISTGCGNFLADHPPPPVPASISRDLPQPAGLLVPGRLHRRHARRNPRRSQPPKRTPSICATPCAARRIWAASTYPENQTGLAQSLGRHHSRTAGP